MMIEEKRLTPTELVLYFPDSLPLNGAYYYPPASNAATKETPDILISVFDSSLAAELLLTDSFLYLHAASPKVLSDLEALSLAELDDYTSGQTQQSAPLGNTAEKCRILLKVVVAPFLQKDGGDIEFVSFEKGIITVRFLGKCHGCPYAQRTLKERVEKNLIRYLPEVREVVLA